MIYAYSSLKKYPLHYEREIHGTNFSSFPIHHLPTLYRNTFIPAKLRTGVYAWLLNSNGENILNKEFNQTLMKETSVRLSPFYPTHIVQWQSCGRLLKQRTISLCPKGVPASYSGYPRRPRGVQTFPRGRGPKGRILLIQRKPRIISGSWVESKGVLVCDLRF